MTKAVQLALLTTTIALSLFACGNGDETPVAEPGPPLAADADGATVYQARCASCHGTDLRGTQKGPSQLSIVYEPGHHGDEAYRSAIRKGTNQHHWTFGNMPAVADITDAQIEAVVAYIRTEQERLGFER